MTDSGSAGADGVLSPTELPFRPVFEGIGELLGPVDLATVTQTDSAVLIEIPVNVVDGVPTPGASLEAMLNGSADRLGIWIDLAIPTGNVDIVDLPPGLENLDGDVIQVLVDEALASDEGAAGDIAGEGVAGEPGLVAFESGLVPGLIVVGSSAEIVLTLADPPEADSESPGDLADRGTADPFAGLRLLRDTIRGAGPTLAEIVPNFSFPTATSTMVAPEPEEAQTGSLFDISPISITATSTMTTVIPPRRRSRVVIGAVVVVIVVAVGGVSLALRAGDSGGDGGGALVVNDDDGAGGDGATSAGSSSTSSTTTTTAAPVVSSSTSSSTTTAAPVSSTSSTTTTTAAPVVSSSTSSTTTTTSTTSTTTTTVAPSGGSKAGSAPLPCPAPGGTFTSWIDVFIPETAGTPTHSVTDPLTFPDGPVPVPAGVAPAGSVWAVSPTGRSDRREASAGGDSGFHRGFGAARLVYIDGGGPGSLLRLPEAVVGFGAL